MDIIIGVLVSCLWFDLMANMIEKLVRHNADHKSHFKIITLHMMEIDNDEFTVMVYYTVNVLCVCVCGGGLSYFSLVKLFAFTVRVCRCNCLWFLLQSSVFSFFMLLNAVSYFLPNI